MNVYSLHYRKLLSQIPLLISFRQSSFVSSLLPQLTIPSSFLLSSRGKKSFSTSSRSYSSSRSAIPKTPLRIVFLGPPGSGKGTQTTSIKKDFNLNAIVSGDILRTVAQENTELGQQVREFMKQGTFVPDPIILKLLSAAFQAEKHGWVLDGFPRNDIQARHLDKMLEDTSQKLTHVFFLKVDEKEVTERIKGRLVHLHSGRLYHVTYNPPKRKGLDDITGEPLVQRADDNPEKVIARLRDYNEKTLPLIRYYENFGLLSTISAPTSNQGYVIIKRILNEYSQK